MSQGRRGLILSETLLLSSRRARLRKLDEWRGSSEASKKVEQHRPSSIKQGFMTHNSNLRCGTKTFEGKGSRKGEARAGENFDRQMPTIAPSRKKTLEKARTNLFYYIP